MRKKSFSEVVLGGLSQKYALIPTQFLSPYKLSIKSEFLSVRKECCNKGAVRLSVQLILIKPPAPQSEIRETKRHYVVMNGSLFVFSARRERKIFTMRRQSIIFFIYNDNMLYHMRTYTLISFCWPPRMLHFALL